MSTRVEIDLLGPMRLRADGRLVDVTTGRLRALIAVLALSAGRTVTVAQLIETLWAENLPASPRRSVQTYVTRLRTLLGPDLIATSATGYLLHAEPDAVDVLRFQRLLERADGSADPLRQRAHLTEALALWRGRPFDDVESAWLAGTEAPRLAERYLAAQERRIALDLELGRPADLVPELRELTTAHPLREPAWALLLETLERSGRRAEALAQYERVRARLSTELGVEPGPRLQTVYARLLAQTPARRMPPSVRRTPRQLPADVPDFVGRADALALLDHAAATSPVATVSGTAGVGKTTLAVHWAHSISDRFPDGQLYVNLRGFDPDRPPVDPTDAIRGFLDALRVPHELIPADTDGQAALYRSVLTGRRMLVLLDNARDARQARPLLPGSADCLTVVTSRDQLLGLAATTGARSVTLDLPPVADARELLVRRIGDRAATQPTIVDELVTLCARLPLALAVAAARVAEQPESLEYRVAELRAAGGGLEAFAADDATIDLRSVFSWSYDGLSGPAAQLFRLVGSAPGPDIGTAAAAALAGLDTDAVRPLLNELTRAHLLAEALPGRYGAHDLLRAYAAELAGAGPGEPTPALRRLLDHYLATALAASRPLRSDRETFEPVPPPTAGPEVAERIAGPEAARAWFAAERRTLVAAVDTAADRGYAEHAWQLAWALTIDLDWRGRWRDIAQVNSSALLAVRVLDDTEPVAHLHRLLGRAYGYLDRNDDADAHLQRALALYAARGDLIGQARTLRSLGVVKERTGRHEESLDHDLAALELFRRIGQPAGLAGALNAVGWGHAMLGRCQRTLEFAGQALEILRGLDDRLAEAATFDTLGFAHHQLGAYDRAVDCFERALDLLRELDGPYYEVVTLRKLADSHEAAGDTAAAAQVRQQAVAALDELGERGTERLRAELTAQVTEPDGSPGRPGRQPASR
ncbi:AfsR/SARP family transcriptional regulator [Jiangella endophytica]|uniref:AfsR/SARP family transcriptional regulator n=1 Tax=Jiangella endophytica TaxID=1623398 RepID=UPI000E34A7A4|nr:BTAD domain-containing putative transcriptional regulator [Jiangella endophytica]